MAARTLASARRYYLQNQRLSALILRAVRRAGPRGVRAVASETTKYQLAAAALAATAVAESLKEQGITAPPEATLDPEAFAGVTAAGASLVNYLDAASNVAEMEQIAVQEVRDAGRIATGVEVAQRPNLAGYVRYLNPPSCARCVILAGRFYRYSTGFERHPLCDCVMLPTNEAPAKYLISDPMDAFERGEIQTYDKRAREYKNDLSVAETQAIKDGADIAKVVNIRRIQAGLKVAGRVLDRRGRITPEAIYEFASDRDDVIRLLMKNGYIV